jgi:serpin B
MRKTILAVMLTILAGCRNGETSAPAPEPEPLPPVEWSSDIQTIADASNHFTFDLYKKLAEDEKGNVIVSPFSAHTALGMTSFGARGQTRDQMTNVLHLPKDEGKALSAGELGRYYSTPRKLVQLSVTNSIWGQKDVAWRPEFLELQKTRFGAGFEEADFKSNPDTERIRINKWIETKTNDRVKDLLQPKHIDGLTRMVLANAVYFKGTWATQFPAKKTRDLIFHLADGGRVTVPTMYEDVKCRWGFIREVQGAKIVELPYSGGELSMVVILPMLPDGLPAIEKKLTPESLAKWISEMLLMSKPVGVSLPKFRFEKSCDLPKPLESLGMVDAFKPGLADFSGMASGINLFISAVAHKAFIEVNEEGTEAAAATAVVSSEAFGDPPAFTVEHPFLFLIRDTKRGTVLFIGRVMNPKQP